MALSNFLIGLPAMLLCLILQITVIGWIPAAIWAVYALSQYKTDQKIKDALGNFAAREIGRRPMILPLVIEV